MILSKLAVCMRRSVRVVTRSCSGACKAVADGKEGDGGGDVGGSQAGIVVGAYSTSDGGFELTPAAIQQDSMRDGAITKAIQEFGCLLKTGKALMIGGEPAIAVVGLGEQCAGYNELEALDEHKENIRKGIGAGVTMLAARGCRSVQVEGAGAVEAAAEAAELASWRYQEWRSLDRRLPEPKVHLLPGSGDPAKWMEGSISGRAQNWARLLSDTPANHMTPVHFGQAVLDMLCPLGVKVIAHDHDWITSQNMRAFLTVARGSCETPIFLECLYDGAGPSTTPILLAAKGITFDSGGLCLKHPQSMVENRGSMAGAAVVVAAIKGLAELKVPVTVRAVIPLCENMISGQCMKVGDIVPALNGINIQIEDTDMEGRLALADALVYGQAAYRPSLVMDVATLTHGILLATGGGAFGCFANTERSWHSVRAAGAHSGDRPWRMPLWKYYDHQLTNEEAVDLRNKGSGRATPCLGAAFLKNFVCGEWIHMDITGVGKLGHAPAPPYLDPLRMTGRPTRTLLQLLRTIHQVNPEESTKKC